MDLKEHQEAAPSRCSLLVSLQLPVPLLPGGSEGLPQDCCSASIDVRRLLIPAACLVLPATAHATEQILWCPNRTVSSSLSKVNAAESIGIVRTILLHHTEEVFNKGFILWLFIKYSQFCSHSRKPIRLIQLSKI